jgi:hypothetical protein
MKGLSVRRYASWIVLPVLALFVVVATGCDSSESVEETETPSARFEAKVAGAVSGDMSGDASVAPASDFGFASGAALPISIDPPAAIEGRSGLAIVLSTIPEDETMTSFPEGRTLLFFLPGDERGEARRYEFSAPSFGSGSPTMFFSETPPEIDASTPIGVYSSFGEGSLTTAPITSGALEVTRVTDEGIFGTFTLQTQAAISITLPSDPSTSFNPDATSFEPVPFATTIEGSFEAERIDLRELQPPTQQ